jgi:catalase
MDIDTNPANYEPNSINDNWPRETPPGPNGADLSRTRNGSKAVKFANVAPHLQNIMRILACSG